MTCPTIAESIKSALRFKFFNGLALLCMQNSGLRRATPVSPRRGLACGAQRESGKPTDSTPGRVQGYLKKRIQLQSRAKQRELSPEIWSKQTGIQPPSLEGNLSVRRQDLCPGIFGRAVNKLCSMRSSYWEWNISEAVLKWLVIIKVITYVLLNPLEEEKQLGAGENSNTAEKLNCAFNYRIHEYCCPFGKSLTIHCSKD